MTARIERRPVVHTRTRSASATRAHFERFRAPFSLRCGALLIDYILVVAILAFSTFAARILGGGARLAGGTAETVGWLIAIGALICNFIVLTVWRGQTVGKWATGLKIENMDGERLSIGRAIVRHVLGYPISIMLLGAGFLVAALNSHGRTLHDFVAGTIVVREHRHRGEEPSLVRK